MSRILLIALTLIILIGGGYLAISSLIQNFQNPNTKPVTLVIWGIKDNEQIINNVILGYKKLYPNVTIKYITQTPLNYRTRVQAQILSGQGPDIFALNNTWVPMYLQSQTLSPASLEIFSSSDFGRLFYKVASDTLVFGNKIYAIPSEIDGLALFYNEDILKGQGVAVPKSWDDLVQDAAKLRVVDKDNRLTTGSLGLGNTQNVENWSEILGLLFFQQPNVSPTHPNTSGGKEVISFFKNPTQSDQIKVWDPSFDNTTQAFINSKLAFYFGPYSKLREIKQKNPNLHFSVIPVPQLPDKNVDFSCFWGYGVSSKSKNQSAAWQFLRFLTDKATEQYINQQENDLYGLGRPYARVDLQENQIKDKYLGAFVSQGPIYKSFYLCSDFADNGLNDNMIQAYKESVESGDLATLELNISKIVQQFGASATIR